jgi:hypothetical protein
MPHEGISRGLDPRSSRYHEVYARWRRDTEGFGRSRGDRYSARPQLRNTAGPYIRVKRGLSAKFPDVTLDI